MFEGERRGENVLRPYCFSKPITTKYVFVEDVIVSGDGVNPSLPSYRRMYRLDHVIIMSGSYPCYDK